MFKEGGNTLFKQFDGDDGAGGSVRYYTFESNNDDFKNIPEKAMEEYILRKHTQINGVEALSVFGDKDCKTELMLYLSHTDIKKLVRVLAKYCEDNRIEL